MDTLTELVIVLGTAAVVTVVFQALKLPVVLGYVLAGLLIGPHVPVPLVADTELIGELSELGVILLMFTIGLELPLHKLARVGAPAALTAVFEVALVIAAGTLVAMLLGMSPTTAVFAGTCLGISSTMLVAKSFDELGWKGGFTEVVFAILVFEDIIAIVLLAVVTAVSTGSGLDARALGVLLLELAGFLAVMLVGGLLVVPRAIRWIGSRARRETLVIASLAVCFGMSALAAFAGFSVALGAFIAGVLIAESGYGHRVFSLVEVFRDVFAMMFFVSVGMSIDPSLLAGAAPQIAALTLVVLLFKPLGVTVAAFLSGNSARTAARAGLSLAQIGELSFIIAGVLGNPELLAIAVGVSCLTTLISSVVVRRSDRIASGLLGRLPGRIATFVSFYEGWVEDLRQRPTSTPGVRRHIVVLAVEATMMIAIVIAGATLLDEPIAQIAAVAVAGLPLAIGIVRRTALLARTLATAVIPRGGDLDVGRAPRQTLATTFELGIGLLVVAPIVATVQPFVPGSFAVLIAVAAVLAVLARRSITDFTGHVRAGSEVIREMLVGATPPPRDQLASLLPGFEDTATATIPAGAASVGRTLADLDVRARTGATVLAIVRGDHGMATPSPKEPLRAGDVIAFTGSEDAIASARSLLED